MGVLLQQGLGQVEPEVLYPQPLHHTAILRSLLATLASWGHRLVARGHLGDIHPGVDNRGLGALCGGAGAGLGVEPQQPGLSQAGFHGPFQLQPRAGQYQCPHTPRQSRMSVPMEDKDQCPHAHWCQSAHIPMQARIRVPEVTHVCWWQGREVTPVAPSRTPFLAPGSLPGHCG